MKKLLLCAAASALAAFYASAATADTSETGTVTLTGTVPAQCAVISGGAGTGVGTFGDTVAVNGGTLADSTGHLASALSGATNASAGFNEQYQIMCTGANNAIALSATPRTTAAGAPTGYANAINYTAEADYGVVGGTSPVVQTFVTPLGPTAGPATLGSAVRLANAANNVTIRFYTFHTANATDVLVAGAYSGVITVTIGAGT